MSTLPRKPARVKPAVEAMLTPLPASQPGYYVLDIDRGAEASHYWLKCLPADFGRAFRLEKFGTGETYDVLLDGERSTCECLGHLRWQTWCKHIVALRQLEAAGKLPPAPKPAFRSVAEFARCDPAGFEAMQRDYPPLPGGYDEEAEEERRFFPEQ
jgi:hypothetical protein